VTDPLSLAVSGVALAVSLLTAWLTFFRRGEVKMSQPTVIFFGPDTPRKGSISGKPKVYLRTLLYSTSKKGWVVESMHISLSRNETKQNFNIWVYDNDSHGKLVRGSGLFVGETGVTANHHFLLPSDDATFAFSQGEYRLEVYAQVVGKKISIRLFSQSLIITSELSKQLEDPRNGLYFDWGPDSLKYAPHVDHRGAREDQNEMFEMLKHFKNQAEIKSL
jgi:hypothetical protein